MAINYPGPFEVRLFYTVNTLQHEQRLNLALSSPPSPGDLFSAITAVYGDTTTDTLDNAVDDWVGIMRPLINSAGGTFDFAELWEYEPESFEANFVSSYSIGLAATGGGSVVTAGQMIFVFRTREGGIMKINVLEGNRATGVPLTFGGLSPNEQLLVTAITSGATPWMGRDTSYPFSFSRAFPGQNEAIFKKRFRN